VQLVGDRGDFAGAGDRLFQHAPAGHLADRLGEVADADAPLDQHAAGVRLLLAHDHAEDGRLAGAVRADEPDLLAAKHGHGCVEEEDASPVLLRDRLETDHDGSPRRCTVTVVANVRPSTSTYSCRSVIERESFVRRSIVPATVSMNPRPKEYRG